MDSCKLLGFIDILRQTNKIVSKNGKLIASTYLLIYCLFYFLNFFSTKPLLSDSVLKAISLSHTSPTSPEFAKLWAAIKKDTGFFLAIKLAFILANSFVSCFSRTAIVFISALTYCGKSISFTELFIRVARAWLRPFITSCYTALLVMGYFLLSFLTILSPWLVVSDCPAASKATLIVLSILATIFYIYLSVVWVLGLVVSVIEESFYGIEALGKAERLVKGKRLHGFLLNFLVIAFLAPFLVLQSTLMKKWPSAQLLMGMIITYFICLAVVFLSVAYTVLYFQCKKKHGEEVELHGSTEYSKIPTTLLVHEGRAEEADIA